MSTPVANVVRIMTGVASGIGNAPKRIPMVRR